MPRPSASSSVLMRLPLCAERELACRHAAVHGLGVAPRARPGGRVAGVADGQVPVEGGEGAVVEDVRDQTLSFTTVIESAVADGHAGRLLAPVLQGVEAEVGQVGHRLARGVDAEDAARLAGRAVVVRPGHHCMIAGGRRELTNRPAGGAGVASDAGASVRSPWALRPPPRRWRPGGRRPHRRWPTPGRR